MASIISIVPIVLLFVLMLGFKMAIQRMEEELKQKEANTKRFMTFLF